MSLNDRLFPPIAPVPADVPRPFWSVVIPAYDRPDYLVTCLESVLAQAPDPEQMQILVIDDCSPTPLAAVVAQVGQGRVTYHRNARNLHNSATFNVGLGLATGQWIHLLHDDDWVMPGFYAKFQAALAQTYRGKAIGAACCRFAQTDDVGNWMQKSAVLRSTPGILANWLATIAVGNPLSPPAVVIQRQAYEQVGGYCPEISCGEDWELYKRVAIFYDWWYQPETLACYRQHPGSITHSFLKTAQRNAQIHSTIALTEPYLPIAVRAELTAAARRNYAVQALNDALKFSAMGHPVLALRSVQDCLKLSQEPEILQALFAQLLLQPQAEPLRQQIVALLLNGTIDLEP